MLTLQGIVFLTLMIQNIYLTTAYSRISGSVCENADQIQYTSLLLLSNLLLQSLPPSLNSHLIQQCASSVTFPRETPQRKLYQSKARLYPENFAKMWRYEENVTAKGYNAYLEIFVSYNIKRSLSSRTQRKNLARMQYLEMFPRQNALSASCKASLKHSLCVIFYKVVKSSTDRMTLQGLQVMFLPITSGQLIWGTDIIFKINRNLGTY